MCTVFFSCKEFQFFYPIPGGCLVVFGYSLDDVVAFLGFYDPGHVSDFQFPGCLGYQLVGAAVCEIVKIYVNYGMGDLCPCRCYVFELSGTDGKLLCVFLNL